ncbi:AAA family ATPase [Candidatus Woesebacteria bacterium]|nr:AAA family ATPase [Candidatus Woesebacteria bacterium]
MVLARDQIEALEQLLSWFQTDKKKNPITLGGYAGTGKTTLISLLRKRLHEINPKLKVGFVSYTGKAARVLRQTLNHERCVYKQDTVGTIHSLIYTPVVNDKKEIVGWKRKEKLDRELIIIDEGSMVDGTIWRHLLGYKIPIIVVGDHGQLPPIRGNFNLIAKPTIRLEQIHRQARTNPIIGLSIQARENGFVRPGEYSSTVKKYRMSDPETREIANELLYAYDQDTLVLCGYNHTRKQLNTTLRQMAEIESSEPIVGDRVICLRNNYEKNIFNGMQGTILSIEPEDDDWYRAEIEMDGEEDRYKGLISVEQFYKKTALNFTDKRAKILKGDLFDFGYALTVHKAQGSQAKKVILFEERFKKMNDNEWRRWLYTAVTRAEEELYIFG